MQFFINGTYSTQEDAKLSVLDLGLLRGIGVFEYLRTYNNRPFQLLDHLKRLRYSAKTMGLTLPYSFDEITDIINTLLTTSHPEHSVKIIVTGGTSLDQMLPSEKPSFLAFSYPLILYPTHFSIEGIKAITTTHQRFLPESKTTNYAPAILALTQGKQTGAQEALYLNSQQEILEATTSNFFAFQNGVLLTPPEDNILLGITRSIVLRIGQEHFPVQTRPIVYKDLSLLDEAFITASNKEIMPITHIDDFPIGSGKTGPLVQQLKQFFTQYTQQATWPELLISRYE